MLLGFGEVADVPARPRRAAVAAAAAVTELAGRRIRIAAWREAAIGTPRSEATIRELKPRSAHFQQPCGLEQQVAPLKSLYSLVGIVGRRAIGV